MSDYRDEVDLACSVFQQIHSLLIVLFLSLLY